VAASSPYPPIDEWRVPHAAVAGTLASVADGGRRGVESGVFWLGRRAVISEVTAVVLLRGRGVVESAGRWEVSPDAYGRVARWARARGIVLLATAHTHGHGFVPRLSRLDRRHLVRAPDLLALVLGDAGEERDPTCWSWNVCVNGTFRTLAGAEFAGRVQFVRGSVLLARADAVDVFDWEPNGGQ
jgi:hypothetical protein